MELNELIFKHALKNAVDHEGKALVDIVMNRVIGENPDLKKDMKSLGIEIKKVLEKVNSMDLEEQKQELLKVWPDALEKKIEEKELPELANAVEGKFIVRFAPNPTAPLHIGHARQALLNWFYREKYKGKYILRFDDTDPKVKAPMKEAYDWIIEDLGWLGIKPDEIMYASDRLDIYYEYAKKLLEMGNAYICTCETEKWKEMKIKKQACPCRELSPQEQVNRWEKMFSEFKEGKAVYRVKTDIDHPNPAIRDWVAFKIVDNPNHPRKNAKIWPLLNFASGIDDHLLGITHIIRGVELAFTEPQQKYVYKYLGWKYPEVIVTGRVFLEGATMSKSKAIEGIKSGKFSGWDDPKLGTLRGLKKKGIFPETIQELIFELGVRKNDVNLVWENIDALNKRIYGKKYKK